MYNADRVKCYSSSRESQIRVLPQGALQSVQQTLSVLQLSIWLRATHLETQWKMCESQNTRKQKYKMLQPQKKKKNTTIKTHLSQTIFKCFHQCSTVSTSFGTKCLNVHFSKQGGELDKCFQNWKCNLFHTWMMEPAEECFKRLVTKNTQSHASTHVTRTWA